MQFTYTPCISVFYHNSVAHHVPIVVPLRFQMQAQVWDSLNDILN